MELINLFIEENLEDKSGVSAIALVDSPAIEEGWIAFSNQKKAKRYTIQCGSQKGNFNEVVGDQQVLAGALMIPNKRIYPVDDETGKEYEVVFTPETIKKIQEKYVQLNLNNAINEMHNANLKIDAFVLQHFIIDRKAGVFPPMGQDHLEDGTWFGYIKVKDKAKWDTFVKTGIYTGFSVEGVFYEEPVSKTELSAHDIELLDYLMNH